MRKTTKMKLSAILGAAAILVAGGAFAMTNNTTVNAEDATPTLKFKGANVVFDDGVHLMYAVDEENVAAEDVQILVWDELPTDAEYVYGTQKAVLDLGRISTEEDVGLGAGYAVYYYEELAAKQMTDVIYARAYANVGGVEYYSEPLKYSVLTYAYNKLGKTTATPTTDEKLQELLPAMLEYGALTQKYLNYKEDRLANADYTYVELSHAKLEDGFNKGLYLPEEELTITIEEGYKLSINAGSAFVDNGDGTATLTVPNNNVVSEDLFVEEDAVEEEVTDSQYYLRTEMVDSNGVRKTYFVGEINGSQLSLSETATTQFNFEWTDSSKTEFYLSYGDETPIYVGGSDGSTNLSTSNTATVTWTFAEAGGKTVIVLTDAPTRYLGATESFSGVKAYATSNLNKYAPVFQTEDVTVDAAGNDEIKVNVEVNALEEEIALTGGNSTTLKQAGSTYNDVTITWEVTEGAGIATLTTGGNTLEVTKPAEETTVTLTASIACGDVIETKIVTVKVTPQSSSVEPVETTLATFTLGANGSASHNDGTKNASYSETVNGIQLSITGGNNMYPGARDAKGNSCIKFGSSSATGSMTFTVPENVTSVKIYVAKYKTNTAKVSINGTTYTLTKNSNDGAYDEIVVDTTSTKTITFATVSGGVRAMLNTIEFIGFAS